MIPIELYGIQPDMVERFYDELPDLVEDVYEDKHYIDALYEIESERSLNHLHIADRWAENTPLVWNDDIENEVLMALRTIAYPKVHLLSLIHI